MTRNDGGGRNSDAFDEWTAVDAGIRSFLDLSVKWSAASYSWEWKDAKRQFAERFDSEKDDPNEHVYDFYLRMGGLMEADYLWMLRAGALRDAVTAFEVYAEKSAEEVLRRWQRSNEDGVVHRLTLLVEGDRSSPSWGALCRIHRAFGNSIDTDEVDYVRKLRHVLAHQRGELRTEKLRLQFVKETGPRSGGPFDSRDVPLA